MTENLLTVTKSINSNKHLSSILPKNYAGPVEKLISDFFRLPKKVGANDLISYMNLILKESFISASNELPIK